MKQIVLAGGCFWGVEAYFKRIRGVIQTKVGYTDGDTVNPSYRAVCTGKTHHVEACEIFYDENIISLEKIFSWLYWPPKSRISTISWDTKITVFPYNFLCFAVWISHSIFYERIESSILLL